jgi:hypothetical protein
MNLGLSTPETEKVEMERNIFKNKISLSFLVLNICFQKYLFQRHNGEHKVARRNCTVPFANYKVCVGEGGNGGRRQLTG